MLTRKAADTGLPSWDDVYGPFYDYAYDYLTANGYHAPYGSVNFSRHSDETGTSAYFEGRLLDGLPVRCFCVCVCVFVCQRL